MKNDRKNPNRGSNMIYRNEMQTISALLESCTVHWIMFPRWYCCDFILISSRKRFYLSFIYWYMYSSPSYLIWMMVNIEDSWNLHWIASIHWWNLNNVLKCWDAIENVTRKIQPHDEKTLKVALKYSFVLKSTCSQPLQNDSISKVKRGRIWPFLSIKFIDIVKSSFKTHETYLESVLQYRGNWRLLSLLVWTNRKPSFGCGHQSEEGHPRLAI